MTTITKKQESKGAKDILNLTGKLSQVLKQFDGIYSQKLPNTDGLTVESWMSAHGVERFVSVSKTGAQTKKGYTPGCIRQGWDASMKKVDSEGNATMYIYKAVTAKYRPVQEECMRLGLKEDAWFRVFSEEEALKDDGAPIKRYELVSVGDSKWSVSKVLKGLTQSRNIKSETKKHEKALEAWDKIDRVYIIVESKNEDGTISRRPIEICKNHVEFEGVELTDYAEIANENPFEDAI